MNDKLPNFSCLNKKISFFSVLTQAYFRQGVALQYLGRHADALAAFASGLAQDPKSLQLLVGMVEAAMKSPLRGTSRPRSVFSSVRLLRVYVKTAVEERGNANVTVFILFFYSVTSVAAKRKM